MHNPQAPQDPKRSLNYVNQDYGNNFQPFEEKSLYAKLLMCSKSMCTWLSTDANPTVRPLTVALKIRFGKVIDVLSPGVHRIIPSVDKLKTVSMAQQMIYLPRQRLLTKDGLTVGVNSYVQFIISDPILATYSVDNYKNALQLICVSVLKAIVGSRTVDELESKKKGFISELMETISKLTYRFGLRILSMDITQVDLPQELELAMATVADSKEIMKANVYKAEAINESAKLINEAAKRLANPISMELNYAEILLSIAKKTNDSKSCTLVITDNIMKRGLNVHSNN